MRGAVHAGVRRRIPRSRSRWAAVARLGHAWWFFGNLYESIVDVPQLLVDAQSGRARRILAPGSPVRYYAPALPLTLAATAATLLEIRRTGHHRRAATAALAMAFAATLTPT
jgi:hypothetical protein